MDTQKKASENQKLDFVEVLKRTVDIVQFAHNANAALTFSLDSLQELECLFTFFKDKGFNEEKVVAFKPLCSSIIHIAPDDTWSSEHSLIPVAIDRLLSSAQAYIFCVLVANTQFEGSRFVEPEKGLIAFNRESYVYMVDLVQSRISHDESYSVYNQLMNLIPDGAKKPSSDPEVRKMTNSLSGFVGGEIKKRLPVAAAYERIATLLNQFFPINAEYCSQRQVNWTRIQAGEFQRIKQPALKLFNDELKVVVGNARLELFHVPVHLDDKEVGSFLLGVHFPVSKLVSDLTNTDVEGLILLFYSCLNGAFLNNFTFSNSRVTALEWHEFKEMYASDTNFGLFTVSFSNPDQKQQEYHKIWLLAEQNLIETLEDNV